MPRDLKFGETSKVYHIRIPASRYQTLKPIIDEFISNCIQNNGSCIRNDPIVDDSESEEWKEGFIEFEAFFDSVMEDFFQIITTKEGKAVWNKKLKKRNLVLIDKLGGITKCLNI